MTDSGVIIPGKASTLWPVMLSPQPLWGDKHSLVHSKLPRKGSAFLRNGCCHPRIRRGIPGRLNPERPDMAKKCCRNCERPTKKLRTPSSPRNTICRVAAMQQEVLGPRAPPRKKYWAPRHVRLSAGAERRPPPGSAQGCAPSPPPPPKWRTCALLQLTQTAYLRDLGAGARRSRGIALQCRRLQQTHARNSSAERGCLPFDEPPHLTLYV